MYMHVETHTHTHVCAHVHANVHLKKQRTFLKDHSDPHFLIRALETQSSEQRGSSFSDLVQLGISLEQMQNGRYDLVQNWPLFLFLQNYFLSVCVCVCVYHATRNWQHSSWSWSYRQ